MSAHIPDTARDAKMEEKIPDETAPLESFDLSTSKRSHVARWLFIGSVVAVALNIVWTCILVTTQARQTPDL
jgi:hypothetical protein